MGNSQEQINEAVMKECSKCKELKELNEFYPNKSMRLGVTSRCKKCINANTVRLRQEQQGGVYFIRAENGTYIGESKHLTVRFNAHRRNDYESKIRGKILEYKVLEYVNEEQARKEREVYWISKLNPTLNKHFC